MPIPRLRPSSGPALFSYGFRPFFLFGAVWAAVAMLVWLPLFYGEISILSLFAPREWHIHEMLYGFLAAVITGFLLTAVPNWTGRLPLQGWPLFGLLALWLVGRCAVAFSALIGWQAAAMLDLSFLLAVAVAIGREIAAGKNWRNGKVLAILVLLIAGNAIFHIEAHAEGRADLGMRLGIAAAVMLVSLIGGRVVPSFTRNWLARENPGRLPVPFNRFDAVALGISGVALLLWLAVPGGRFVGASLILAGLAQAVRLGRWAGWRTASDRLVLVLHVGYAFVPLGFVLTGLSAFLPGIPESAGVHAWTGGAIGTMTLAIMARASLGHTGRALRASPVTQAIFAAVVVAALARVCADLIPAMQGGALHLAAAAWVLAFLGFALAYAPVLAGPRKGAHPA